MQIEIKTKGEIKILAYFKRLGVEMDNLWEMKGNKLFGWLSFQIWVPKRMIMPWIQIRTWKIRAYLWDKWDRFGYFTYEIPMRYPGNILKVHQKLEWEL